MRPRDSSPRPLTGQKTLTFSGTDSPRVLNHRCNPSETVARTASLTVQPKRSFIALNAGRGPFNPRPVRWGPILRLKKRSGRGVTILRPGFNSSAHGTHLVFQMAVNLQGTGFAAALK